METLAPARSSHLFPSTTTFSPTKLSYAARCGRTNSTSFANIQHKCTLCFPWVCGRPYLIGAYKTSKQQRQQRNVRLLALTAGQSDSLIVKNIANTGRLVNLNICLWATMQPSYNICSESHFLPGVLAPLCANSIFNCEQIEPASRPSAMLERVNSVHPEAESAIAI